MSTRNKLSTFFTDDVCSVREASKGRSPRLMSRRNIALCDRFYFYQKIHHYNFAKCVEKLSDEFYISQIEVPKILNKMSDYIAEVKATPPAIRDLKDKHPHFNWVQ